MSTTFEWRIPTLDILPKHVVETAEGTKKTLKGVISGIHWRLVGTSEVLEESGSPFSGSVYGSEALDISELDGVGYSSYAKAREDKPLLLSWLFESMGEEKVAQLEAAVEQRILNAIEAAKPPLEREADSTTDSVNL